MNVNKLASDLIVISSRLIDLMARENESLRNWRHEEAPGFLKQKDTLCRAFEIRVGELTENEAALGTVSEELKKRLPTMMKKVQDLTLENAKLLKVNMETSRQVVESIAEAAKEATPGPGTYTANGITPDKNSTKTKIRPVSINQSL